MYRLLPVLVAGLFCTSALPVSAHHSYGMFDRTARKALAGTVEAFGWTNPHGHISLVDSSGGVAVTWSIELGPPAQLSRDGWKRTSLKPGDKVTAIIVPLRDGSPGGHLLSLTKADGQVLEETNKTLRGEGGDKLAPPAQPAKGHSPISE